MNIYLVRHGETQENKNKLYYGNLDVSLNEKGKTQALKASEALREINFDRVYTSERSRTKETASLILNGRSNPFMIDKRINEMDFGEFEGKDFKEIQRLYPKEYEAWKNNWKEFSLPGGESYTEVYKRVDNFMEELLKENYKNVLVVSHGGIIRTILCYVLGGNLDNFWKFSSNNCDLCLIKYEYGNIFIDSITHMK
jgi:alpha-ribazole phosphatase